MPPGVSNMLTATYSIGRYLTVVTRAFSYFNPVVGSVRPSYGNTAGGNFITVTGSNFGNGAPHDCPSTAPFARACNLTMIPRFLPAKHPNRRKPVPTTYIRLRLASALHHHTRPWRFSRRCRSRLWAKWRALELVRAHGTSRHAAVVLILSAGTATTAPTTTLSTNRLFHSARRSTTSC